MMKNMLSYKNTYTHAQCVSYACVCVTHALAGGVLCGALDAEGGVHEASQELWRNCALASFLRSELYDPELTMHSEVLHRYTQILQGGT